MPRAATREPKPSVLHQTIEIPAAQPSQSSTDEPKESRPDFWSYMHSLSPDQWKDHIVYLTREKPKTQMNGVVGGYLAKITDAFDIDDVKTAWGGYEFSYIMKRKNDIVYHGRFSIEAPPKLDPTRESISDNNGVGGGNASTIAQQVVNLLREELERNRGTNGADRGTTEKAVEMLSKASDKAMEVILKQVPQNGSGGTATATGNPLLDKLITAAIERLLAPPAPPPAAPDPAKQLETMLSIFTKIDEIRGSGGGRRRDWKETAVEKGLEYLPQVLDTFRETREANVRIASDRARAAEHLSRIQNPSARPSGASVMTPRPAGAPPAAPAEPTITANSGLRTVPIDRPFVQQGIDQPPAEPPAAPEVVLEIETVDRNSAAFLNTIKMCVVEMIQRGDHGEQIVDFLDGAKPGFSNTLVDYTPEQLTAFFRMDPILRAAVELPNWPEVLDEARKYILDEGEPGEGEEEPELETVPPAPAPRKTRKPN